jgi:hypothetical protein
LQRQLSIKAFDQSTLKHVKSIDKSEPLYIYKLVQKERKKSSEDSKSSDTGSKIMDEVESKIIDHKSPEISDIDDLNKDVTKSHDIEYMSCDKTDTCVDTNSREDNTEMSCKKNDTSVDTNCQEDNTEQQNCVLHSEENVESKSNRKSDIHNATKTVFSDHIEI